MKRREFLVSTLAVLGMASARVSNTIPVNQGLRFARLTALLIQRRGLDRVLAVSLEGSHVCFAVAGAVAAVLRQLGTEAWFAEGGEGLENDLDLLQPDTVYLAYFGGLPDPVVQRGLDGDLARLAQHTDPKAVVLHWPTLTRGYFERSLYQVEGALDWIEARTTFAAINDGRRAVMKRLRDPLSLSWEEVDALPLDAWPPLTRGPTRAAAGASHGA